MGQSALVTGAGGFIGHHLVQYLVDRGYHVRGADIKRPEYAPTAGQEFEVLDLRRFEDCLIAARGVDEVYHLAADMGGIGYITENHADVARNNVLIEANMLEAARIHGARRFFYSSSACVYPLYLQAQPDVTPLKESDAYPADAEPGYGWEKLYGELLCRYYRGDHGLETRVARFHNIYGPEGTYDGGREKAPAAICRKVASARDGDEIEVWGDGELLLVAQLPERRAVCIRDLQPWPPTRGLVQEASHRVVGDAIKADGNAVRLRPLTQERR